MDSPIREHMAIAETKEHHEENRMVMATPVCLAINGFMLLAPGLTEFLGQPVIV